MSLTRSFYVHIDPALKLVHTRATCPAAKVANKYNDLVGFTIKTLEDARRLDQDGNRACKACIEHERHLRSRRSQPQHVSPPGFRN
jgi:hypothetical protein